MIEPERASAIPETRLCVTHAKEVTKFGGEFIVTAQQSSLGKAGSLKKNYGDVTTSKARNHEGLAKLKELWDAESQSGNR
jgi:hypothetical protein